MRTMLFITARKKTPVIAHNTVFVRCSIGPSRPTLWDIRSHGQAKTITDHVIIVI